MGANRLHDAFCPELSYEIEEAKGEVDGKAVLAKVKGEFFFPGGVSRNNRYYPRSLWDRTLANEDVKHKLEGKLMFGTISHDQPIDDKAMLEGRISHIVSNLTIDGKGRGVGEALLLDTPAGRILNTVFRAGSKLFVSSRAEGEFTGKTFKGVPVVDEESYRLHTFDFVLDPGFLKASPQLAESVTTLNEDFRSLFGVTMDESFESAISPVVETDDDPPPDDPTDPEGSKTKRKRNEAKMSAELLENLNNQVNRLQTDLKEATTQVDQKTQKIGQLEESLKARDDALTEAKKATDGSAETKAQLDGLLAELKELGTPEEIRTAYTRIQEFLGQAKSIANGASMDEILDMLKHSVAVAEKYGTLEEMDQAYGMMNEFLGRMKDLGTPEQIAETFEYAGFINDLRKDEAVAFHANRLSEDLGVPVDAVIPMVEKGMTDEAIRDTFRRVSESARTRSRYTTGPLNEGDKGNNPPDNRGLFDKSRGERLLEGVQGKL